MAYGATEYLGDIIKRKEKELYELKSLHEWLSLNPPSTGTVAEEALWNILRRMEQ